MTRDVETRVEGLQTQIRTALIGGGNTRAYRAALDKIESEAANAAAAVAAAAEAAAARAARAAAALVDKRAHAYTADAGQRLANRLEALQPRGNPTMANLDIDPAIAAAAQALAAAELVAEADAAALRSAESRRDSIRAKLNGMDERRREIAARRARGEKQPDDGPELALIGADHSALSDILVEHDAAVTAARAAAHQAVRQLDAARSALTWAEAKTMESGAQLAAADLDRRLLLAIGELRAARDILNGGPIKWTPSVSLMAALVPLDLARSW